MQNKARSIISSVIPATQYAINAINQYAAQPIERAVGQAQAQLPFVNAQAANPKTGMDTLQGYLDTAKRLSSGQFGRGGIGNTYNDISNTMNMLPEGGLVGDIKTLGQDSDAASLFGNTLRSAQDMLPLGKNQPVHPEDIQYAAPALERMLNTPLSDAAYHINQLPQDHALIQPLAEYYVPGVTKAAGNDPIEIARSLAGRIFRDKKR